MGTTLRIVVRPACVDDDSWRNALDWHLRYNPKYHTDAYALVRHTTQTDGIGNFYWPYHRVVAFNKTNEHKNITHRKA